MAACFPEPLYTEATPPCMHTPFFCTSEDASIGLVPYLELTLHRWPYHHSPLTITLVLETFFFAALIFLETYVTPKYSWILTWNRQRNSRRCYSYRDVHWSPSWSCVMFIGPTCSEMYAWVSCRRTKYNATPGFFILWYRKSLKSAFEFVVQFFFVVAKFYSFD